MEPRQARARIIRECPPTKSIALSAEMFATVGETVCGDGGGEMMASAGREARQDEQRGLLRDSRCCWGARWGSCQALMCAARPGNEAHGFVQGIYINTVGLS